MDFSEKLWAGWDRSGGSLCVGLDPIIARMPAQIASSSRPVFSFNRLIVDLLGDLVCAFKPQAAHHAAEGAEDDLAATIAHIRRRAPHALVILDAKRGDIGSTARMYAREAFERYDADAVTVNPFMGEEAVLPFLEHRDRGAVVLCRTSNPDAAWIQRLDAGDQPLFAAIAERAETRWNSLGNVMLVVGATIGDDMALARAAAPTTPFLVPGVGEQGGSIEAVLASGGRGDGRGLVVSASRSILYAGGPEAIRAAAEAAHGALAFAAPSTDSQRPAAMVRSAAVV